MALIKPHPFKLNPSALLKKLRLFHSQLDDDFGNSTFGKLLKQGRTRSSIWDEIEGKYLSRYSLFLRVDCDHLSTGIWGIAFPGSRITNPNYAYKCFDLPPTLIERFNRWTEHFDQFSLEPQGLDLKWYHSEGEALAKELALNVAPSIYVEYDPFVPSRPEGEK